MCPLMRKLSCSFGLYYVATGDVTPLSALLSSLCTDDCLSSLKNLKQDQVTECSDSIPSM